MPALGWSGLVQAVDAPDDRDEPLAERLRETAFLLEFDSSEEPRVLSLRPGPCVLLGRAGSCALIVDDERVSTVHALLLPPQAADGRWRVVDLDSTNGTALNGQDLAAGVAQPLEDGCRVRFGRVAFEFVLPETLRRRLGSARPPARPPAAAPPELVLRSEGLPPIPVALGRSLVIGRSRDAEVVLIRDEVSRQHARIHRDARGVFVEDLGSANGTLVAGRKLGSAAVRLEPGDELQVGPCRFRLEAASGGPTDAQALPMGPQTIHGDLRELTLTEVFQRLIEELRSGRLEVRGLRRRGVVTLRDGEVCQATTASGLTGTLALRSLLELEDGTFTLHTLEPGDHDPAPDAIQRDALQDLLLEQFLYGAALELA